MTGLEDLFDTDPDAPRDLLDKFAAEVFGPKARSCLPFVVVPHIISVCDPLSYSIILLAPRPDRKPSTKTVQRCKC